jgi:hypothetical protein
VEGNRIALLGQLGSRSQPGSTVPQNVPRTWREGSESVMGALPCLSDDKII